MKAAARFTALICVAAGSIGAATAQQCSGPNFEETADRCFATQGCVWNKSKKLCEPNQELQTHNGDERFYFEGDQVKRNRDGVVTPLPVQIHRQGLDRVCPNAVVRTFRELGRPLGTGPGSFAPDERLGAPSFWLTWPGNVESKLKIREAWLSLRREGACHAFMSNRANPPAPPVLSMSLQALKNWGQALQGNAFRGVIDCRDWKIYLYPTKARSRGDEDLLIAQNQKDWKIEQLKKIQWGKSTPKSLDHIDIDHGWAALKVAGVKDDADTSFATFCKLETSVKSNFLGFSVWATTEGRPYFVHSSRQLNGPNLDQFQLDGQDWDQWILPNTRLLDSAGASVFQANGDLRGDLLTTRGLLTPELRQALETLGGTMPDRPFK